MTIDLILLHPPSLYDFRKLPGIHGPISDVVPSTPIFEMYPIGFASLSEYLERRGFEVRIVNVAMKMLKDERFDVEKFLRRQNPAAFGIDLHWMAHVQGGLALAEIIKRFHPRTPVMMGGLSATYYHEEILGRYPFVDLVMRGDSTEKPMAELLHAIKQGAIKQGKGLEGVPNLTWRDAQGTIHVNPLSHVPETLDDIAIDYRHIMKKVVRYIDPTGYQPFVNWYTYPVTAVFTCRGCTYNCKTCGGSARTFRAMANRKRPAYRDPCLLARDIFNIADHLNAPVMVIGDIFQPGEDYAFRFLRELKTRRITNHIAFEFFVPPSRHQLEAIAEAVPNFNLELSPESHDEEIRRTFGRPYSNEAMERMIADAIELGCKRIDVFFMTGLPKQTSLSVFDTVDYCRNLLERFQPYNKLLPFISPLAPFLDPGSSVFEEPEKYGYRLLFRTVEEHRNALLAPSWKYILNYETQWMTRDEIVYTTYEAGKRLNRLKAHFGLIDAKTSEAVETRIDAAVHAMKEIDRVVALSGVDEKNVEWGCALQGRLSLETYSMATVCGKKELEWPTRFLRMNLFKIMKTILTRRKPNVSLPSATGSP